MRHNIPTFHNSGLLKQPTTQQRQRKRISIVNLLNPENRLGTKILSHYDASSAQALNEEVRSIADDYKPVFDRDMFQSSTIESPNISEFESVYGLISGSISCGSITFNTTSRQ